MPRKGLEEKKADPLPAGPGRRRQVVDGRKAQTLMEKVPFYAIKGSPVNESPLGLFNATEDGAILEETTASRGATSTPSCRPGP
jgi:serine protein kinase